FRVAPPAVAAPPGLLPDAVTRTVPPIAAAHGPGVTLDLPPTDARGDDAVVTHSLLPESSPPSTGPPPLPSPVPERIGRFVVRRFLGEGAFGRVYEAYDAQLDRAVALKVAKPELLQGEQRVRRFLREAKAAAN